MNEALEISTMHFAVLALLIVWLAWQRLLRMSTAPWLGILARWYRMGLFSLASAVFCQDLNLIERPLPILVLIFMLVWVLLETGFGWLMVTALSKSTHPLFPSFSANLSGLEWPMGKKSLRLKEQIKAAQFIFVQSLKSEVGSGMFLRMAVFEHESREVRLQIYFVPQIAGGVRFFLSLQSFTSDGSRLITDNLALPFGGFYPEQWAIERRPKMQSFEKLLALHTKRRGQIAMAEWGRFDSSPLEEINQQQRNLERLNLEMGFLNKPIDQEEHGKLTYEGRYRVWIELLLLNYFGISRRYC